MSEIVDVVVVGYGPVGMASAALLGQAGHSVVALERYAGMFNLPRAGIFDDETMRTFDKLGLSRDILTKVRAQDFYQWRNGKDELLLEIEYSLEGRSGWAEWYQFFQPDLEKVLDSAVRRSGNVDVRFNTTVTGYSQDAEGVTVEIEGGESIRARYVIAADGGNGFTREELGVKLKDYGFSEPWMPCDFELLKDREELGIPAALQICDPAQPRSVIALGPTHQRFAFLLGSEDEFEEERDPEKIWKRVAKYLRPGDAKLIRVATYVFRSLVADKWRHGKVLLAGDVAHQMPPFLGQGMCSGLRDAQNLAFRLDLILTGRAGDDLLDGYQTEREPQVTAVIERGIQLGKIQTMRDPIAGEERDARLLADRAANRAPEKMIFPGIGDGFSTDQEVAGSLFPQGLVAIDGRQDRFDEIFGFGFALVADEAADELSPTTRERAEALLDIVAELPNGADVGDVYRGWFGERGAGYALVRPDFYVYGTANDEAGVVALLDDFESKLAGSKA
jgi:3-(3-hydroxy-phenyl)propionate hydroxylase/flavoprotein hydroxylase